jgi:hypothetical protein
VIGLMEPREILAFCAIPKTGTITLVNLLRRQFGLRHFDCVDRNRPPGGNDHLAEDLRYDLRVHPWARSIAGHGLKPFIDYQELEGRLLWYTMLREPTERYVSEYRYEVSIGRVKEDLPTWMREYSRDNFQVRWLAGEEDVEAAKAAVLGKIRAVGLLERYRESLLIFRQRLGIPEWDVAYPRAYNVAKNGEAFQDLPQMVERYREEIAERNAMDIALYEFVRDEVWPKHVADYGGTEKLENEVKTVFGGAAQRKTPKLKHLWCHGANRAYRNLVYKPLAKLDRLAKRRARMKQASGSGKQAQPCP